MNLRGCLAGVLLLVASIMALPPCPAMAEEPFRLLPGARFLMGMDWSMLWLSGEMLIPAGGQPGSGTKVDVSSELGVGQAEGSTFSLECTILDKHLLEFDNLIFSPTGLKQPQREFRFQNRTYPAGAFLETRLDMNWMRFNYGYKLVEERSWWIAPRIGAHYLRCITSVNGETKEEGVISNTRSLDAFYPVIGLEGRYLFPYGIDAGMQMEAVHLITRGFLTMIRFGINWEIHPNMVFTVGAFNRAVQYIEDNQALNNEWLYLISGYSAGVSFGF
jgi:hypothetical protein